MAKKRVKGSAARPVSVRPSGRTTGGKLKEGYTQIATAVSFQDHAKIRAAVGLSPGCRGIADFLSGAAIEAAEKVLREHGVKESTL